MAILLCLNVFANTIFVDPSVTAGSVANTYPSLSSAITASSSGDTIFIAAGSYASASPIVIDKSLTIAPQDSSEIIDFYGSGGANNIDMNVNGSAGMIVKLFNLKFNTLNLSAISQANIILSNLSISNININGADDMKVQMNNVNCANSIIANASTASVSTRTKVYLIDCNINTDLTIDQDNYELICAHCVIGANTTFRFGSFVVSKTNNLYTKGEVSVGANSDSINKILIAADTINNILEYQNDSYKCIIANNLLKTLFVGKWNSSFGINQIVNNQFYDVGDFSFNLYLANSGIPSYNFDISNNIFDSPRFIYGFNNTSSLYVYGWENYPLGSAYNATQYCGINIGACPSYQSNFGMYGSKLNSIDSCYFYIGCWGYHKYSYMWGQNLISTLPTYCQFPNRDAPGTFKWTYNGFSIPGVGSIPGNLTFVNVAGSQNTVNAGNPGAEYTDIDLTRNDRGRLGGPYSILNYNPTTNPSNGKAFIFDLDIPTTLQATSQPVNIRAKGYHRN